MSEVPHVAPHFVHGLGMPESPPPSLSLSHSPSLSLSLSLSSSPPPPLLSARLPPCARPALAPSIQGYFAHKKPHPPRPCRIPVPRVLQGYIAHTNLPSPTTLTVGLCLGPYGGPRGGGDFL